MKENCDEEMEFDSICFHDSCVKEDDQLYSTENYNHRYHQSHSEECRRLSPGQFKDFYEVPHRVLNKIVKKFYLLLNKEITKRQKQCGRIYKRVFLKQARHYFTTYTNKFRFQGCSKMLGKLMKRSRLIKQEEIKFLTLLNHMNEKEIEQAIEERLLELTNSFSQLNEKIFNSLQLKIAEVFFERHHEISIKQQEIDSSEQEKFQLGSEREQFLQQSQVGCEKSQMVQSLPIKPEQTNQNILFFQQSKEQESSKDKMIRKRQKKYSHLDRSNILSNQRCTKHSKVNYLIYHQYGNHSKQNNFEYAYIINTSADIKFILSKKQPVKFHVLIINYKMSFQDLIQAINIICPFKIIIHAKIQNFKENLLSYLNLSVLNSLIKVEQNWDFDTFYLGFFNCQFIPTIVAEPSFKKLQITAEMWDNLLSIQNVWIGYESDLTNLIKSNKSVEDFKSLKIGNSSFEPIEIRPIRQLFEKCRNLKTLIIQNLIFENEHVQMFLQFCNNPLKCIVLKNIKNITKACIQKVCQLPLTHLIIHTKGSLKCQDFSPILKISTLESLSLKCIQFEKLSLFSFIEPKRNELKNLEHLNLSNCKLELGQIMRCINSANQKTLKYLNLENNTIDQSLGYVLRQFVNLSELNLDRTSLNFINFLRAFNDPFRKMERLSILGYFGPNDKYLDQNASILTDEAIKAIFRIFPYLKHLNLGSQQLFRKAKFYCPFKINIYVNGVDPEKRK